MKYLEEIANSDGKSTDRYYEAVVFNQVDGEDIGATLEQRKIQSTVQWQYRMQKCQRRITGQKSRYIKWI